MFPLTITLTPRFGPAILLPMSDERTQSAAAMISISLIDRDPGQPRKHFDEAALQELAESIDKLGLLQPVVVRPSGDRYIIVAGERRFRAVTMLGHESVPVMIVDASSEDAFVLAVAENVNRKDMNPIEEGGAFQLLIDRGRTKDEVAALFGKTRVYIETRVYLLRLDPPIQQMVAKGQISQQVGWHMGRLTINSQYEVLRAMNAGKVVTDAEIVKLISVIAARESDVALFDVADDAVEAEATAARAKVSRYEEATAKAAAALDSLLDVGVEKLATMSGPELERLVAKLQMLAKHAGRVRSHVEKAAAVRKVVAA